jgi:hypothetical protein
MFFDICNFSEYIIYLIVRYNIEMGVTMASIRVKNEYEEMKLVRWDPIIARFEEHKLRN